MRKRMYIVPKGQPGYLKAQRKYTLVRTIVYFALSLSIFVLGYVTTKTRTNLLTVVAVLGCLPASKSLVNTIMFFRSMGCSENVCRAVQERAAGFDVLFDLIMTTYDQNFQLSSLVVKGHNIVALTEWDKTDLAAAQKHIEECLKLDGYKGYTIKIFREPEKYLNRIEQMMQTEEEENREKGEVLQTLLSISL